MTDHEVQRPSGQRAVGRGARAAGHPGPRHAEPPRHAAGAWRESVRGTIKYREARIGGRDRPSPEAAFMPHLADASGQLHNLEAHQAARKLSLDRARVADLYKADPPLITTGGENRVLTDGGRARLGGESQ